MSDIPFADETRSLYTAVHSDECYSIKCPCYQAGVLAGSFGVTIEALAEHLKKHGMQA